MGLRKRVGRLEGRVDRLDDDWRDLRREMKEFMALIRQVIERLSE